ALLDLSISRLAFYRDGERARKGLRIALEENHREIFWLGRGSISILLFPLGNFCWMLFLPACDIFGVELVCLDPVLGHSIVGLRPLRHHTRLAGELVLLEPSFHVRSDRLAFPGAAAIFHDRANGPGNTLTQ